jgi:hypothetical protein
VLYNCVRYVKDSSGIKERTLLHALRITDLNVRLSKDRSESLVGVSEIQYCDSEMTWLT